MACSVQELEHYGSLAEELAVSAMAQMIDCRPTAAQRFTKTSPHDWVTTTDIDIERQVRDRLSAECADHVIVGEEFGQTGSFADSRLVWYVDPIDGTTNFVHGLPWASFSLSLADEQGVAIGVVADAYSGELFSARRGAGARLNGMKISCATDCNFVGGAILTELAGVYPWPGLSEMMQRLAEQGCVTRIMGSSALALANLGAGRASGVVLSGFNPIDVSAGILIAREAGAHVCAGRSVSQVLGATRTLRLSLLMAAAPGVVDSFVDLVEALPGDSSAPSRRV
jgi:myo-inositol-1(or 4)-monophosphatase